MEQVWPQVLINGAVVILLWGLVWRSHNQRIDTIQDSLDRRVERDYCRLQHHDIHEDILEIKRYQERMVKALEDIRVNMAKESASRSSRGEAR